MYCVLKTLTESILKKYKNIRKSLISKNYFQICFKIFENGQMFCTDFVQKK